MFSYSMTVIQTVSNMFYFNTIVIIQAMVTQLGECLYKNFSNEFKHCIKMLQCSKCFLNALILALVHPISVR